MSIPNIHKDGNTLNVSIDGGFNMWVKNMITNHISNNTQQLIIDLDSCSFIDSEGVIFMYKCQQNNISLQLINPPKTFFEILEILELEDSWQPNIVNTKDELL